MRLVVLAFLALLAVSSGARSAPVVPEGVEFFNAGEAEWEAGGGPGSMRAPIYGDPSRAGAYLHLIRVPPNTVGRARKYTDARAYTVVAGTWLIGFGSRFDRSKLIALPAGSYYSLPAGVAVFNATGDDGATVQIGGQGPTEHIDLEPADGGSP
jgi:hypothetical protein